MRAWLKREVTPHVDAWEEAGEFPDELRQSAAREGILGAIYAPEYGGVPPKGSTNHGAGTWSGTKVDPFFDLLTYDELARAGAGGWLASLFSFSISLPPVLAHGSEELKRRVAPAVLSGRESCCLCITEPGGGSDVAAVKTTYRRSADGSGFVLSGTKKFITGGMKSRWFLVLARREDEAGAPVQGVGGLSLFLVERGPRVKTRRLKTQGWLSSNTAFIEFDGARVPLGNLLGKEGKGFPYTMANFNHERFMLSVQSNRMARVCLEEAVTFARRRKTFGKALIRHQAIAHKLAEMTRKIQATHLMLEDYALCVRKGVPEAALYGE